MPAFLAPIVAALPSFLIKFVGENVLESTLGHLRKVKASANEALKIKTDGKIRKLEAENQRRKDHQQFLVDRQRVRNERHLAELTHPELQSAKVWLMRAVAIYWIARFAARGLGLIDFHIIVPELNASEEAVSYMVLVWMFGSAYLERFGRR